MHFTHVSECDSNINVSLICMCEIADIHLSIYLSIYLPAQKPSWGPDLGSVKLLWPGGPVLTQIQNPHIALAQSQTGTYKARSLLKVRLFGTQHAFY